jgi:hypothetical protein
MNSKHSSSSSSSSPPNRERATFVAMLLVISASWILILAETYVFFVIVRPLGPPLHVGDLPSSILKIALTIGLGAFLVFAMFAISWIYLRAFRTPTPAS